MSVIIYYLLENVLPSAAAPSLEASAPLSHHSRIRRRVAGLSDPATNRSRTSGRRCRTGEDARSGYRRDTDSGERRRLRRAEPDRQQAGDPHPTALMFHVKHLFARTIVSRETFVRLRALPRGWRPCLPQEGLLLPLEGGGYVACEALGVGARPHPHVAALLHGLVHEAQHAQLQRQVVLAVGMRGLDEHV